MLVDDGVKKEAVVVSIRRSQVLYKYKRKNLKAIVAESFNRRP